MFRIWKICLSMIVGMLCLKNASSQGVDSIVLGQTGVHYSVTPTAGSTYQWFIIGGQFQGASIGNEVIVDWIANQITQRVGVLETSIHGCSGDTVWLDSDNGRVIFPYIFGKRLVCEGENVSLYASSSDSVYKDIYYRWSTGETAQTINLNVFKKTSLFCVVYYNGDAIDTAFITIDVLPIPKPEFSWSPLFPKKGEEVTFRFNTSYPFQYNWIVNGIADSLLSNEFTTTFDSTGVNKVGLYMKNELGCDNTKTFSFNIETDYPFHIPEVFSPNGDGKNDELVFDLPEGLKSFELTVFNRWGQIVFKSNSTEDIVWDGRYDGQIITDGAYIYQVVGYAMNNKYLQQSGTIAVVK